MPIFYSIKTSEVILDTSITKTCVKVVEHIYIANHNMWEGGDSDRISEIPVLSVSDLNKIENEHRCKLNVQIDPDTLEKFIVQSLFYPNRIQFRLKVQPSVRFALQAPNSFVENHFLWSQVLKWLECWQSN